LEIAVKVFISHSSAETWIARKICEDVMGLGIDVFLDNKDVQTGDDFDIKTNEHIRESDEIVILVSQTALRSNWVMIECGAARALCKRLVPILIDVAPNELPQPINRHLARDLNQIDTYYRELRQRLESGVSPQQPVILPVAPPIGPPRPLEVGDRVAITDRPRDPDEFPVLSEDMRRYLGMTAIITALGWVGEDRPTYRLDVDDGTFYWAERWLHRLDGGTGTAPGVV
jgi:hypothetical protein